MHLAGAVRGLLLTLLLLGSIRPCRSRQRSPFVLEKIEVAVELVSSQCVILLQAAVWGEFLCCPADGTLTPSLAPDVCRFEKATMRVWAQHWHNPCQVGQGAQSDAQSAGSCLTRQLAARCGRRLRRCAGAWSAEACGAAVLLALPPPPAAAPPALGVPWLSLPSRVCGGTVHGIPPCFGWAIAMFFRSSRLLSEPAGMHFPQ